MHINAVLVGVISAFGIIGATTIIEFLFRILKWLVSLKKPEAGFKFSIGIDAGLMLQLGTSLYFAQSRLTEKLKCPCAEERIKNPKISGKLLVIFSSAACIALILLSEIGIIFSSQPTTKYVTMKDRRYEIFSVGKGAPAALRDIETNRIGQLEIGVSNFTERFSTRYKCTAFLNPFRLTPEFFVGIQSASREQETELLITSVTFKDVKNSDKSDIDGDTNRRRVVNQLVMYLGTPGANRPSIGLFTTRLLDTLDSPQKEIFTDFQEADAHVIENAIFQGLGLECITSTNNYRDQTKEIEFSCDTKKVIEKIGLNHSTALKAFERAIREAALKVFRVTEFTEEFEAVLDEKDQLVPGKEVDGIVTRITEVETSELKFHLLCIVAVAGLLRILSGTVIDFRKTAEDFLLMTCGHEVGSVGPGNWDGIQLCPLCKDEFY